MCERCGARCTRYIGMEAVAGRYEGGKVWGLKCGGVGVCTQRGLAGCYN